MYESRTRSSPLSSLVFLRSEKGAEGKEGTTGPEFTSARSPFADLRSFLFLSSLQNDSLNQLHAIANSTTITTKAYNLAEGIVKSGYSLAEPVLG